MPSRYHATDYFPVFIGVDEAGSFTYGVRLKPRHPVVEFAPANRPPNQDEVMWEGALAAAEDDCEECARSRRVWGAVGLLFGVAAGVALMYALRPRGSLEGETNE